MAGREYPDAFERDYGGVVPDIVKQFVVYLYRHIRSVAAGTAEPGQGNSY